MNERIEKLGEKVDLLGEFTPTKIPGRYVGYITEEKILKFAELIVRECVNEIHVADVGDLKGKSYYLDKVAEHIENHFGVEE